MFVGGTADLVAKYFFILTILLSSPLSVPPRQVERQFSVLPPFLSLKVVLLICPGFLNGHLLPQWSHAPHDQQYLPKNFHLGFVAAGAGAIVGVVGGGYCPVG